MIVLKYRGILSLDCIAFKDMKKFYKQFTVNYLLNPGTWTRPKVNTERSQMNNTCTHVNIYTCTAVAAYLKVVRQWKPSSVEGKRGGEHERVIVPPFVRGVLGSPPRFF